MADLEKVIKGLQTCVDGECKECPYGGTCSDAEDFVALARDALELLKSYQPRVLTLEEARNHEVVWTEDRQDDDVSMCVVQRNMNDSKLYKYGVQWRVWSARPTDEQRKAAKWDE